MPYTASKMPGSTDKMPPHAKKIWLAAFNSASKQYKDESRAFAVAFAAVKKMYSQDKDGRWHRMKEAAATVASQNDLPDSAFAIVLSGGKKDSSGKTVPRSLRKLPYKHADGSLDLPHLRNALARANQIDASAEQKAAALRKLKAAAKQAKIGDFAESEDFETLDADEQAWLDEAMPAILEECGDMPMSDYDPKEEARRMGIHSLAQMLSTADRLDLTDTERGAITTMMTRLSTELQNESWESDAGSMDEALNLAAIQEAIEQWLIGQELQEAGQRHRNEDYQIFDQVLDVIKRLRGQSPAEARADAEAMAAEEAARQAETPEVQMAQGYHAGEEAPDAEAVGVAESTHFTEAITFLQESGDEGRAWQVSVIQAGLSKNGRRYSLDVLREAAKLFEGARVYAYDRLLKGREVFDHLSDEEYRANPKGYAKDLIGYLKAPMLEGARLVATLQLLPSADWLRDNLRAAFRQGHQELYGLSIDAEGDGHWVESGGSKILEVDAIKAVTSVDVVTFPAAGGKFMRLVASVAMAQQEAQEVMSLVESLQRQGQRLQFELVLHDVLDDLGVPVAAKRDARQRILAALPLDDK